MSSFYFLLLHLTVYTGRGEEEKDLKISPYLGKGGGGKMKKQYRLYFYSRLFSSRTAALPPPAQKERGGGRKKGKKRKEGNAQGEGGGGGKERRSFHTFSLQFLFSPRVRGKRGEKKKKKRRGEKKRKKKIDDSLPIFLTPREAVEKRREEGKEKGRILHLHLQLLLHMEEEGKKGQEREKRMWGKNLHAPLLFASLKISIPRGEREKKRK